MSESTNPPSTTDSGETAQEDSLPVLRSDEGSEREEEKGYFPPPASPKEA